MNLNEWLPLLVLCTSLVTALLIFPLREDQVRARTILNMGGATLKVLLVGVMLIGVLRGETYATRLPLLPGYDFVLLIDPISLTFATLSAGLWWATTLYAIGYLEHAPNRSRFFGFFSLCVTAAMGVALAGNPITFVVFYELLTLTTYPLIVHRGTSAAIAAGRTYLLYTLIGGTVLLGATVWLHAIAGPVEFHTGGVLWHVAESHRTELIVIFAGLMTGLGVKAALVPLHGWLPVAMIAPAPVSALLHAVAVVKAGAYGVVRFIYDLFGPLLAAQLNVLTPLALLAGVTIIYGSVRALTQTEIKRRLAYSTVSQVSYIVLGAAILGPVATTGALVHLIHQGLMKITLFLSAGNFSETIGVQDVRQMNGVGRRMPLTTAAFTIGAFGMIGAPPVAGFVSKWYLGTGAVIANQGWAVAVLATSTMLNAAYFLPLVYAAWFREPDGEWPEEAPRGRLETKWTLLAPCLATAAVSLAAGLFAGFPLSPLSYVEGIAREMYPP